MKKYYLLAIIVLSLVILSSLSSIASLPGDFNADGKVDFDDLMIFALAYGSSSGSSNWNAACDLEPDGKIDFEDLMLFAMNYGEISELISEVEALAITYQANIMDKLQEKMEQLAVEGKIKDSYRLNELSPSTKGTTQHVIDITWHSYPDAEGYKIYRSVNTEGWEVYNWPAPSGHEWYSFRDNSVSEGNTYTYYVTAYGSGWETEPSAEVTIDTWLPPCSLISPEDQSYLTDSTPAFTGNPVGLGPDDFPYGSISYGYSDFWVFDVTANSSSWQFFSDWNDLTVSSVVYNHDGQATSLVSGHTYMWDSWGYGYDENWNLIAISQSEDWEFFYNDGIIPAKANRALLVGVGDYMDGDDNDLQGPPYDVDRMYDTLSHSDNGLTRINKLKNWQATKSAILAGIANTFSQADSDDVSYFYFSGHGTNYEGISYLVPTDAYWLEECISVSELESALSAIPGTKVVFLDACHSGGFIGKEISENEMSSNPKDFNQNVIDLFASQDLSRDLTDAQYQVLTSCRSYQSCSEFYYTGYDPFGLFTAILCEGCGYDYYTHPYWADVDANGEITLNEAYDYTYQNVDIFIDQYNERYGTSLDQDTQVYPTNSNFVIIESYSSLSL